MLGSAGKLMGLAPYGVPDFLDERFVGNTFDLRRAGVIEPELHWVKHCRDQAARLGYDEVDFSAPASPENKFSADVAASTQRLFEETMLSAISTLKSVTDHLIPVDQVCLSGGCALNCPTNSRIASQAQFRGIHVNADCDDSGLALGAALYVTHNIFGGVVGESHAMRPVIDVYRGRRYTAADILSALEWMIKEVAFEPCADNARQAAADLVQNKVIGWFEGRSEAGPRALGHRSILADPRDVANWRRVNQIKGREYWRPFAPAVLEKESIRWFGNNPDRSPHMLFTGEVKSTRVPAVRHVDGSARIQTVDPSTGVVFDLIQHFFEATGVPMVLNTSFNGPSESIVESPKDALDCFMKLSLDVLYLPGYRVVKRDTEVYSRDGSAA
jgi:carbamoyltransferase